jgi:hypothetical protein
VRLNNGKVGWTQDVGCCVDVGVTGDDLIKLLVCGFIRKSPGSLRLLRDTRAFLSLILVKAE